VRDFEDLLPRALMDANLIQFRHTLEQSETREPDFSPRYRRSRLLLMNDPMGWMRQRSRPLWKRAARSAACVLLACAVALGSLMAVSPAVRAAVLHWLREIGEYGVIYRPLDQKSEIPPSWRPAWLPEGWYIGELFGTEDQIRWQLRSSQSINGTYQNLICTCCSPGSGGIEFGSDRKFTHERTTAQGVPADYFENGRQQMLFWESPEGHLLSVSISGADRATLERIAENMIFYADTDLSYAPEWIPESYREITRYESIGAGQIVWMGPGDLLTFQYITDPPCSMAAPDRNAEETAVNGCPALYWPCIVPEESLHSGQSAEIGDITITAGVSFSPDEAALLRWEDPKTNTAFQLQGVLEREDMIRIAGSVTAAMLP